MKISVIAPIYKNSKKLKLFLEKIIKQTNKNFEIILIIDSNEDDLLSVVDDYWEMLNKRIKVLYNYKRKSRTFCIKKGIEKASGEYSIIISIDNLFNNNMIDKINEIIQEKQTDIIEFPAVFNYPFKFNGKIRYFFEKKIYIKDNDWIFALTYPFDFNKIYKTLILKQTINDNFPIEINSRFSIDQLYSALKKAKTYSVTNQELIWNNNINDLNPIKIISQWEKISDFFNIDKEKINYAQYFFEVVFISAFLKKIKNNKVIKNKFFKKFTKQQENIFKNIFEKKDFYRLIEKEKNILINKKDFNDFSKIYKIINKTNNEK